MCVYCMCGDFMWKHNPPWDLPITTPYVPQPVTPGPHPPWDINKLWELRDLLREIRDLEAKIGCECEPNKADYLKMVDDRIKDIEDGTVKITK